MAQVQSAPTKRETARQAAPAQAARPIRSRGEVFALFVACSFPIFVWAIANVLITISQWLLRLTPIEIAGVAAYILGFAFLESLVIFALVLVIIRLLPARWIGRNTAPLILFYVSLTMVWLIYLDMYQEGAMTRGNFGGTLLSLAAYLALLVGSTFVIRRFERVGRLMNAFIDRLLPLALLYAVAGLLGAVVVLARNLF